LAADSRPSDPTMIAGSGMAPIRFAQNRDRISSSNSRLAFLFMVAAASRA
jgi:hypothetical protein